MRYPPTIKINGKTLACEFDAQGSAVVLDDLHITWGRDSLYAPTDPSELRIDLIDPDGAYGSDPALFGASITIETSLGVLFRGEIDGISMTPIEIDDPNPSIPKDVWQVSLSATDVIAKLARTVTPGPGNPAMADVEEILYVNEYGANWWDRTSTHGRRTQIQTAMSKVGITTVVEVLPYAEMLPPGAPADGSWYFREPILSSGDDLYELIRSVQCRGKAPYHTNYRADTDHLTVGEWPAETSLVLTYTANVINVAIDPASGASFTIDCRTVSVADPADVRSTVSHNIASLRITEFNYSTEDRSNAQFNGQIQIWKDNELEFAVPRPGGGSAQYESPVKIGNWNIGYTGSGGPIQSQTAAQFAALLSPFIAAVNGKMIPPEFVFDFENESYGASVEQTLLATWNAKTAWSFPGSRYESLTGFGPIFQHIGGELRFRQGWEITGRFAPAAAKTGTGIPINTLVVSPTPTFNQYAPGVTLATLGTVTKGI